MTEHLDAHRLSAGSADIVGQDAAVYLLHLVHVQLTRQHRYVGELRIEAQGLDIGYVELCAEVHLQPYLPAIGHHSHIAGYHSGNLGLESRVENATHERQVLTIDDGIDGQIALHTAAAALCGYAPKVVDGECTGRMRPHVEVLNSKVNAVGSGTQCSGEGVGRPHGSHYLKVFSFHHACLQCRGMLWAKGGISAGKVTNKFAHRQARG